MSNIKRIHLLLNKVEKKLQKSDLRADNLKQIFKLFQKLDLSKKHSDFSTIFDYKAMNLAGIGLKDESFGEIQVGKYVQIIAIAYEINSEGKRVAKNTSLGYYGKAEKLTEEHKLDIIEFILRWRYEKSFQHSDYYQQLLERLH